MKIKTTLLSLFCCIASAGFTQSYSFSTFTSVYSDLQNGTSVNEGITWDDPDYTIPVGFNFTYFGKTINEIYITDYGLGGFLNTTEFFGGTDTIQLLIPYGADITDRGSDTANFEGQSGSLSPISYQLSGTPGSRVLKIEWKNAGFYWDISDDNISTDFVNFQLWLYEGSNDIEIHFGSVSISQPDLVFEDLGGSLVALLPKLDMFNEELADKGFTVGGDPTQPVMSEVNSIQEFTYLSGPTPNGMVYRFSTGGASVSEVTSQNASFLAYPNPAIDFVQVMATDNHINTSKLEIINGNGQVVKQIDNCPAKINIADLAPGVYTLRLIPLVGNVQSLRFIKD